MIEWMSVDTLIDVISQREETKLFQFQLCFPSPYVLFFVMKKPVLHAQGLINSLVCNFQVRNTGYYLKHYLHYSIIYIVISSLHAISTRQ